MWYQNKTQKFTQFKVHYVAYPIIFASDYHTSHYMAFDYTEKGKTVQYDVIFWNYFQTVWWDGIMCDNKKISNLGLSTREKGQTILNHHWKANNTIQVKNIKTDTWNNLFYKITFKNEMLFTPWSQWGNFTSCLRNHNQSCVLHCFHSERDVFEHKLFLY